MTVQAVTLSSIIVSYNTREMTLECLDTLHTQLVGITSEVWVVDNGSSDGSQQAIKHGYPHVHLIENQHNRGFGAANNQAMLQARGELLLLLNSDAFPTPGAVPSLINFMVENPKVAVVGPRLLNRDGSL